MQDANLQRASGSRPMPILQHQGVGGTRYKAGGQAGRWGHREANEAGRQQVGGLALFLLPAYLAYQWMGGTRRKRGRQGVRGRQEREGQGVREGGARCEGGRGARRQGARGR